MICIHENKKNGLTEKIIYGEWWGFHILIHWRESWNPNTKLHLLWDMATMRFKI